MRALSLPRAAQPTAEAFVKGLVTTGVLASIQNRPVRPALDKLAVRRALQGGAALAAGTVAAQAWQRQDLGRALTAIALGTASVMVLEQLMKETKEKQDGQEKA
jgi:hypothetical protein